MTWTKDTSSQSPKVIYTAPPSAAPMAAIIYDPNAANRWCIEYAWLNFDGETVGSVESLMGL